MTPEALAALHRRCFDTPRPWTSAEFAALLATDTVFLTGDLHAFALGRVVAGEAELLTLATDPDRRRAGLGRRCLQAFEAAARARDAQEAFLEVAADNGPAIALYRSAGWRTTGRRRDYYRSPDGQRIDAGIMGKSLA
ncbi:ribosomal-protein-alanine acetyltransferase, putative [Pseudooceanicola batsensis HTCC2597]|uniref:Ribosomal-protein-alanine acetyltransferase, putative n=1 Tax=Pseudooceanicola batsensis (strain ATCC BAA-863 / DSM 15984 / KCTC 12145 / HTCC2597) TaxID=252305 RepID=A3TVE2_PSEBH|nr:GNAT family N-acetyltransferase [Pseudooceanicola batsensis]EAQ04488.1 ribosomal-protein-alanine acetyltransferase, putative [Pseudooceanicola batsensis HTCC2597]